MQEVLLKAAYTHSTVRFKAMLHRSASARVSYSRGVLGVEYTVLFLRILSLIFL